MLFWRSNEGSFLSSIASSLKRFRRKQTAGNAQCVSIESDLLALERALPGASADMGKRYLKSTSLLESISKSGELFLSQTELLLDTAARQAEHDFVIADTREVLRPAFEHLESWSADVETQQGELTECIDVFGKMQRWQSKLADLVAPLNSMQALFRIESARLPEEARQVFAGLTAEMSVVHRDVRETFTRQFEIIAGAHATLSSLQKGIIEQAGAVRASLAGQKEQIMEALERLSAQYARNAEYHKHLAAVRAQVGEAVLSLVVALQTHDIASQRLEAVCKALAQARNQIGGSPEDSQKAWALLRVQKAQLEAVREQIDGTEQVLSAAAQKILSAVGAAPDDSAALNHFQALGQATARSVDLALKMIGDERLLLAGASACSAEFYQSIEPLGGLSDALRGALGSLSTRMLLIALNAQVQAVHIGAGTGLEVLAAATARVSDETSVVANEVTSRVERVMVAVRRMTACFAKSISDASQLSKSLESPLKLEHELGEQRASTMRDLDVAAEAIRELRNCALQLQEEESVRRLALVPIENAVEQLARIDGNLESVLGALDASAVDSLSSAHYRMNSQRVVHAAAVSDMLGGEQPDAQDSASPSNLQEIEVF